MVILFIILGSVMTTHGVETQLKYNQCFYQLPKMACDRLYPGVHHEESSDKK